MQPHGAQWKPNPQPSRTNVMTGAVGCGRADENGDACALIENDDASTPQARTNDNLLNMDKTPRSSLVVLFEMEAHADDFVTGSKPFGLGFLCGWLINCTRRAALAIGVDRSTITLSGAEAVSLWKFMVPPSRIELLTPSLPMTCSTTELRRQENS